MLVHYFVIKYYPLGYNDAWCYCMATRERETRESRKNIEEENIHASRVHVPDKARIAKAPREHNYATYFCRYIFFFCTVHVAKEHCVSATLRADTDTILEES